ncbi:2TM domain-containing protein [Aquimarina addita]|uniref:2TM domain-containing protein n=1 Tax=Aquimarina addita TaxID=870485 RepID=A0ABP6UPH9_9FLAO
MISKKYKTTIMKDFEEQKRYEYAKARIHELKKFYNHVFIYISIVGLLAGLNYYTNQWENLWFSWTAIGWGIGVAFHAIKAFKINPIFDKDWEERKIRKYMEDDEDKELWE